MNECIDCSYYDDTLTFPNTGYCILWKDHFNDNDGCEEFEEIEDES